MANPRELSDSFSTEDASSTDEFESQESSQKEQLIGTSKSDSIISASADEEIECSADKWLLTMYLDPYEKTSLLLEGVSPNNQKAMRYEFYINFDEDKHRFSIKLDHLTGAQNLDGCYCHKVAVSFDQAMELVSTIEAEKEQGLLKNIKEGLDDLKSCKNGISEYSFFSIKNDGVTFNKAKTRFNWCLERLNNLLSDTTLFDASFHNLGIEAFKVKAEYIEPKKVVRGYDSI